MSALLLAVAGSFWLGLLTSVSPCPLATNIAAVSFLGRNLKDRRRTLLSGLAYALGRTTVYVLLAAVLVAGLASMPLLSGFLQKNINQVLGPVFLVSSVFMLGLIELPAGRGRLAAAGQVLASRGGVFSAFLLGALFALAFCPISAALFFGSLIPIALREDSVVAVPLAYGLGTALPVLVFAVVIAFAAGSLGKTFAALTGFETWARRATGLVFLGLGVYFIWRFNL